MCTALLCPQAPALGSPADVGVLTQPRYEAVPGAPDGRRCVADSATYRPAPSVRGGLRARRPPLRPGGAAEPDPAADGARRAGARAPLAAARPGLRRADRDLRRAGGCRRLHGQRRPRAAHVPAGKAAARTAQWGGKAVRSGAELVGAFVVYSLLSK